MKDFSNSDHLTQNLTNVQVTGYATLKKTAADIRSEEIALEQELQASIDPTLSEATQEQASEPTFEQTLDRNPQTRQASQEASEDVVIAGQSVQASASTQTFDQTPTSTESEDGSDHRRWTEESYNQGLPASAPTVEATPVATEAVEVVYIDVDTTPVETATQSLASSTVAAAAASYTTQTTLSYNDFSTNLYNLYTPSNDEETQNQSLYDEDSQTLYLGNGLQVEFGSEDSVMASPLGSNFELGGATLVFDQTNSGISEFIYRFADNKYSAVDRSQATDVFDAVTYEAGDVAFIYTPGNPSSQINFPESIASNVLLSAIVTVGSYGAQFAPAYQSDTDTTSLSRIQHTYTTANGLVIHSIDADNNWLLTENYDQSNVPGHEWEVQREAISLDDVIYHYQFDDNSDYDGAYYQTFGLQGVVVTLGATLNEQGVAVGGTDHLFIMDMVIGEVLMLADASGTLIDNGQTYIARIRVGDEVHYDLTGASGLNGDESIKSAIVDNHILIKDPNIMNNVWYDVTDDPELAQMINFTHELDANVGLDGFYVSDDFSDALDTRDAKEFAVTIAKNGEQALIMTDEDKDYSQLDPTALESLSVDIWVGDYLTNPQSPLEATTTADGATLFADYISQQGGQSALADLDAIKVYDIFSDGSYLFLEVAGGTDLAQAQVNYNGQLYTPDSDIAGLYHLDNQQIMA